MGGDPATNPGTLYLVSTPIGNPDDLSPRARTVLETVDLIAAEDTRVTRTLLGRLGLRRPLLSYHDHNEKGRTRELLTKLKQGLDVALVADAGTPLISDPGFHLVREANQAGVRIVPVPGACAAVAALVVSALPSDRFLVLGFLPRRAANRRAAIRELRYLPVTLVAYESPHRIVGALDDLVAILGDRAAALARSLTKKGEEVVRGRLTELRDHLAGEERIYGEMTLVIEGASDPKPASSEAVERAIGRLLAEGLAPRQVRDIVHHVFKVPRRELFARVLQAAADKEGPHREG